MGHVIILGRAVVAGLWAEKNSIKGICEQKPGLAEGFSPSALLRLSPWGCVRLAFSSAQDAPGLHPSCLCYSEESPQNGFIRGQIAVSQDEEEGRGFKLLQLLSCASFELIYQGQNTIIRAS